MFLLSGRRPLFLLLASILIFTTTLAVRTALGQTATPVEPPPDLPTTLELGNQETIIRLQDRLRLNPDDPHAYALLGLALLQRVRETADASLYTQAEQAFTEALERDPQQLEAVIGQGMLALARHDFSQALVWGERAKAINPRRAQVYGIIGDAQVELGQYGAAAKTIQTMVDTRPELGSYSRVSYIRELHGDTAGAIEAMQLAVDSGLITSEAGLWTRVQLGHLYFNSGDLATAEKTYREALQLGSGYPYAQAGLARVQAAQGNYEEAIESYEKIVEQVPLPEFVIALGELYEVTGQEAAAQRQYALVEALEQLSTEAGMNVDLEFALFKADHGPDPAQAVAQAQAAYDVRPSIHAADVLAWALYQNGEYAKAWKYSQKALRLGTQDALLHFHAGIIAHALGKPTEAKQHLQQALEINPYFSVRYAPQAERLLADIE